MRKQILGSIALSAVLVAGFTACGSSSSGTTPVKQKSAIETLISDLENASKTAIAASLVDVNDSDKIPFGDGSFSPFERVAVLPVVKDADGNVDYNATNKKASKLAMDFAIQVANINEPQKDSATFKASDWIVIDKKKTDTNLTATDLKHHLIHIPTSKPFNPNFKYSKKNTNKVHLVELCNPSYAAQAAGFKTVGGVNGAKVPKGSYHATALPCEVTVYSDNKAIYVDMLNPETIFTLFFTEIFSDPVMDNNDFKTAMLSLPTQVKSEVTTLIHNWLDSSGETYHKTAIKMGPIHSSMSKAMAVAKKVAPYKHFRYASDDADKQFTSAEAKDMAQKIIEALTIHGNSNAGRQEAALFATLPSQTQTKKVDPKWRSAREEPFKVPGNIWVLESCSPVYAKEALNTGEYHTPALPCEIAVQVNPENNNTIDVSILNPDFMFNALFADGMAEMNTTEIAGFQNIIDNINGDLKTIVDYAMEHNITQMGVADEVFPITY